MDVQIIQKILQEQKLESIFIVDNSMSPIWAFDHIKDKHTLYWGKDCMKKFCVSLREHGKNIVDFGKKKMLQLTKEELKSYQYAKVCYLWKKNLKKAL